MTNTPPPPGFYPDNQGLNRWWDGGQWTDHTQPAQGAPSQLHATGPMTAGRMNVRREVVYNRQQKGHSLTLHILLIFVLVGMITVPYYSVSPNHYWHI